jgi:hypothetical protein
MRRIAWIFLLLLAFAIPWEYSLDLGEPLGNVARIAGLLVLLAAVPAILQAGRMRTFNAFCWVTFALYLWFCCTSFWTIDSLVTVEKLRAYFQEMMIVWLVWEFADTPRDLRNLLRAAVAGSCVLAVLTLLALRSPEARGCRRSRNAAPCRPSRSCAGCPPPAEPERPGATSVPAMQRAAGAHAARRVARAKASAGSESILAGRQALCASRGSGTRRRHAPIPLPLRLPCLKAPPYSRASRAAAAPWPAISPVVRRRPPGRGRES